MIMRPVQRGIDGVLFGMIGAQPGTQQAVNAFNVGFDGSGVTADDSPADAPAGREVVFREAAKSNDGQVRRDSGDGNVTASSAAPISAGLIQYQLVVNLVGEDDQIVAPRDFSQLLEHAARAERAGGIVGVD